MASGGGLFAAMGAALDEALASASADAAPPPPLRRRARFAPTLQPPLTRRVQRRRR